MFIADNFKLVADGLLGMVPGIATNKIFVIGISAQFCSMLLKAAIKSVKTGKFTLKNMADYGGMPSSHTAFIVSSVLAVGFDPAFGWRSPLFGFSFIVALIVLVDAVKFRGNVDKINDIVGSVAQNVTMPKHIAHKIKEVVAGVIFAFVYTILFYLFLGHLFS